MPLGDERLCTVMKLVHLSLLPSLASHVGTAGTFSITSHLKERLHEEYVFFDRPRLEYPPRNSRAADRVRCQSQVAEWHGHQHV